MKRWLEVVVLAAAVTSTTACISTPNPLNPGLRGSIGSCNHGVLTDSAELPREAEGLRWLRQDDRHHGVPRFTQAIVRAAATVAHARPGGVLSVGDISTRGGGPLAPHFSHRSGRDADLLLYVSTLDGAPVQSPGFVHFDADGLAWDPDNRRYLRLDVEREWLLVEALLNDPDARIQWIFVSRVVEGLLLEWGRVKGADPALWARAEEVMLQPNPGGIHDDHLHVRTACTAAEIAQGCEHTGPMRAWLVEAPPAPIAATEDDTTELISFLVRPLPVSGGTILSTTAPAAR